MSAFAVLAKPADASFDPSVVQEAGGEFAAFIDSESAAPFMTALRGALEAPMHDTQVLNTAIALSNVVGLLALALAEDEDKAVILVEGTIARSAGVAFPELVPSDDEELTGGAQAMVCRVFGAVDDGGLPDALDGRTLAAIAAYGDAGMMIADDVGLPRPVLAAAIGQAVAQM